MKKRIERLRERIADQENWIQSCGGTLEKYVKRNGKGTDPNRHGDGGEAIWMADINALSQLRSELEILVGVENKDFVVTVSDRPHGEYRINTVYGPMTEAEADAFPEFFGEGEYRNFTIEQMSDPRTILGAAVIAPKIREYPNVEG